MNDLSFDKYEGVERIAACLTKLFIGDTYNGCPGQIPKKQLDSLAYLIRNSNLGDVRTKWFEAHWRRDSGTGQIKGTFLPMHEQPFKAGLPSGKRTCR
jgi:hypothetical protein